MELLLIRHAQTHANVVRALDTAHPGADLTELGEQQVRELGTLLARERIDAVYVSPRLRTRRTARALLEPRGLEAQVRDGLVEVDAGEWEMSEVEEQAAAYNAMVTSWIEGDLDVHIPGAEHGADVVARYDAVVAEILAAGHERAAVVSHGAITRLWCGTRVANTHDLARRQPLRNTGLVRVQVDADGLRATHWDDQAVPTGGEAGPQADTPA